MSRMFPRFNTYGFLFVRKVKTISVQRNANNKTRHEGVYKKNLVAIDPKFVQCYLRLFSHCLVLGAPEAGRNTTAHGHRLVLVYVKHEVREKAP